MRSLFFLKKTYVLPYLQIVLVRYDFFALEKSLFKENAILHISQRSRRPITNKDGVKVYTTDIVVEQQEFAEGKYSGSGNAGSGSAPANGNSNSASAVPTQDAGDGFMNIPDGIDEELPFS